ncbi:MAG: hypothetical protein ACRD3O_01765, partial [Terriglobia bacterium]
MTATERQHTTIGTLEQYPTETAARKAVQVLLLDLNAETPRAEIEVPAFGTLADKFVAEEMPERYSTRKSYESMLRTHIRPRWGDYPLDRVKPMVVEKWFRDLELAPKTKAHIRSLMHVIFKCAERWDLVEMGKNPISAFVNSFWPRRAHVIWPHRGRVDKAALGAGAE